MKININKTINNLYYGILILIPFGWVLNWKYYFSRFISEGFDGWVSVIISTTLVLFASSVFAVSRFMNRNKKISTLLFCIYCVLAVYSINCTTSGQYWDQQIKNKETVVEQAEKDNQDYLLSEYKKEKGKIDNQIEQLVIVKDESITNLDDLWTYEKEEIQINNRIEKLKSESKEYEKKIENILNQNKISAKEKDNKIISKSLYVFYSNILSIKDIKDEENNIISYGYEKVQFVFQVLLAIIIELIAQISIYTFMNIYNQRKNKPVLISHDKLTQTELRHFSVIAYGGINKKQSKVISSHNIIMNIMSKVCQNFTESKYKQIIKKAIDNNLFKKDGQGLIPASAFVDQDFFYKKMCKIFKFGLTDV